MGDETGTAAAGAHPLVPLLSRVDVNEIVIGSNSQEVTTWGEFHLMNHFLSVLDVHHFCQVPEHKEKKGNILGFFIFLSDTF